MKTTLVLLVTLLAVAGSSSASAESAAPSNVCVTQYGVCPVTPPGTGRGTPCWCVVPPGTWVRGLAEYRVDVPRVIPMHWGTFPVLPGKPSELRREIDRRGLATEIVELSPGASWP